MSKRILVVEDQKIVLEGIRSLLASREDYEVVDIAEEGREAIEKARTQLPDIVLMDVRLPELNGPDTTRRILDANPDIRVIALSLHSDRQSVSGMFDAGARGYVLKANAFDELLEALRTVEGGGFYMSPDIPGALDDYVDAESTEDDPASAPLTSREREVLQLVAEGYLTKQIAETLAISPKTVESHRGRIMKKLGLHSVADLTKYAVRNGLTTIEGQ